MYLNHSTFFCFILIIFSFQSFGQPTQTEQETLQQVALLQSEQKWQESIDLLLPLYNRSPFDETLYQKLFDLYLLNNDRVLAYELNDKMLQIRRGDPIIGLDRVTLLQTDSKAKEAQYLLDSLILQLPINKIKIDQFAQKLEQKDDYSNAIKTYLSGRKLMNNPWIYASELAYAYTQLGQANEAVAAVLDMVHLPRNNMEDIQEAMMRLIDHTPKAGVFLKKQITHKIKNNPQEYIWNELWNWYLLTQGDEQQAVNEMIALDQHLEEQGLRVLPLARYFYNHNNFSQAHQLFDYILKIGPSAPFYQAALEGKASTLLADFEYNYPHTSIEQSNISQYFEQLTTEFPENKTSDLYRRFIKIQVLYFQALDWGLENIQLLISATQIQNKNLYLQCKLDYADFLILNQEIWEATIVLGQVDKEDAQGSYGALSRFKSAELAFFRGDFIWSKQLLDILKSTTTDYIANDALDLSVLINEHIQNDQQKKALEEFAAIKLQARTFKYNETLEAIKLQLSKENLESLRPYYLMEQYYIQYKIGAFEEAILSLQEILAVDSNHVLADDATYKIAEVYRHKLKEPIAASGFYEQVILNFPSSTYVISSRNALLDLKSKR